MPYFPISADVVSWMGKTRTAFVKGSQDNIDLPFLMNLTNRRSQTFHGGTQ